MLDSLTKKRQLCSKRKLRRRKSSSPKSRKMRPEREDSFTFAKPVNSPLRRQI